jgi:hypothetical protein
VRGEVAFQEHRTVALGCPEGLRLADLLPPEGGRVSAHYRESTTIGSIVDPSNARLFSRTP